MLTAAAFTIQGYHLGVEDSEIFIPAARKLLHPDLYPYGAEFFQAHEKLSIFGPLLAVTARLTHLSIDWTLFCWYIVCLFATLLAGWMIARASFETSRARWCSVLVMSAVLTMPAANIGLLLVDPYLTPRSFSTPLLLFALVALLKRRFAFSIVATLAAGAIHPQMTMCFVSLAAIVCLRERAALTARERMPVLAGAAAVLPIGYDLSPAQGPYREALYARDYFFLSNWSWYHWLGLLAPLAFLAWFARGRIRATTPAFQRLSAALIPFGIVSIVVAGAFASSHQLDILARLQPLRCFHLITLVFVLLLGGAVGEYAAKDRAWVLPAIFTPLAAGMFYVGRQTYPCSPHVEVPWTQTSSNPWVNALLWVRHNTPPDAVFAVDSRYFKDPCVDVHGFRTISRRSELADYYKDGGAAAMFPDLAPEWKRMSDATYGLNHFQIADFMRLSNSYPVTWTVVHGASPAGMECPYQENGFSVCRIPGARGLDLTAVPTIRKPLQAQGASFRPHQGTKKNPPR